MSFRAIVGTVLVVVGAGFLLDQMDVIDFGSILGTWWPLILIAIGTVQLLTRSVPVPAGAFVILLGVLFQIDQLDVLGLSLGQLIWPLILILIGGFLLLSRAGGGAAMVDSDDKLDSFVIFGGMDRRVTSDAFQGGSAVALFAGAELDLRDARLHTEGAELDVAVAFGGMEIMVPEDWNVKMTGMPIFGGWSNKTRTRDDTGAVGPELKLRCVAAFGGIEVHN